MSAIDGGAIRAEEVEAWRAHVGRQEIRRQRLDVEAMRRFAAAQGASLDVREETPPLGHWAYFLETVAPGGIGPDGHPRRGGLLPPVRLPRRMFASAEISFLAPLTLDAEAELEITVADVRHRAGKSGDLVFVEVDRVIRQGGEARVTERQTIVYRGAGERVAPIEPTDLPPHRNAQVWNPSPVDLFRFSAVTFNSHRIHYDLPYATSEEGYPGLVVHGPFTAAKLFALALERNGGPLRGFAFRAIAPLFCGQPIFLAAGAEPGEVQAIRVDGAVAMSAKAS